MFVRKKKFEALQKELDHAWRHIKLLDSEVFSNITDTNPYDSFPLPPRITLLGAVDAMANFLNLDFDIKSPRAARVKATKRIKVKNG